MKFCWSKMILKKKKTERGFKDHSIWNIPDQMDLRFSLFCQGSGALELVDAELKWFLVEDVCLLLREVDQSSLQETRNTGMRLGVK